MEISENLSSNNAKPREKDCFKWSINKIGKVIVQVSTLINSVHQDGWYKWNIIGTELFALCSFIYRDLSI